MNEFSGKFNDVDFNSMTLQERTDWAIRFDNTLNKALGQPQETGQGQHNRKENEKPDKAPSPLIK
jgi:hypothetical protein